YRVERTRDYTVMSNFHLKDTALSLKAKGLLSMFLSFPEDWNYSTRGLAAICKEGVDAIGNTIKELEKAGYIVRRQLRGPNGRITDTEYIIYEQPQEPPAPDTDEPDTPPPDTASPDTGNPDVVNPDMDAPHMENPAQLNINQSITQKSNTKRSNTHSFPPPTPSAEPVEGMNEILERRDEIREQIEYDLIINPANQVQIDEFVEIMLEVALSRTPTMKIGRDAEYPTAFVQQRFEQITSAHIGKVLEGIRENTTRVWNTRAYLLAALFNAPSTMDNHYTMLVNHDLNTGG
ncbi:MAG: helix-turn-helix domain-containing protein, partial [Oscillospiraceae bacterium]|nr:helix-turn-helix domain-containing protein [Oscillospiraceae bacterium]